MVNASDEANWGDLFSEADFSATLDDAHTGHGRLVMLEGEPGIGKTRAARELASNELNEESAV